jgi:hypothetical protein
VAANKSLPRLAPSQEKLGLTTIMDRALAARYGTAYVHLAAFAIDVDRVREHVEGYDDPRPFGWEVLLTEHYLLERFGDGDRALLEDVVLSILDGEPHALGGQLAFAVWDAIKRGALPDSLRIAFRSWRARPDELVKELAKLWVDAPRLVPQLAQGCLDVELDPPLAPPTREALEAMARS